VTKLVLLPSHNRRWAVADYYATVQLPDDELEALRAFLGEELTNLRLDAEHERTAQERRKRKLEVERKALLDAHLAEAVPLDLLKQKQDGITAELATIESRLKEIAADFKRSEANLKRAPARAGDCETAYREANDHVRRQFNLAFFERLLIGDDLLRGRQPGQATRHAARWRAQASRSRAGRRRCTDGRSDALRQRHTAIQARNEQRPQGVLVGADSPPTPYKVGGWSQNIMMGDTGLETAPRPQLR
jgi:hypothetical protein